MRRGHRERRPAAAPEPGREIDAELAFHLERRTDELIAGGLPPDIAAARARQEFGDLEATRAYCAAQDRARTRRSRLGAAVRAAMDDLAAVLRSLTRDPRGVLAPGLVLACALTLNVLAFSVVRGVLLAPLPVHDAAGVHVLEEAQGGGGLVRASYPVLDRWRSDATTVTDVVGWLETSLPLVTSRDPLQVPGVLVTEGFFDMIDEPFLLGRGFVPGDHAEGAPARIVIAEGLWRDAFASAPDILERPVRADGTAYQIVGVVRAGAVFPGRGRIWIPLEAAQPELMGIAGAKILVAMGRLRPGVEPSAAGRELGDLSASVAGGAPAATLTPLDQRVRGEARTPLLLLEGAVLLVLLAACANAGGMLLTRSLRRRGELAVRASLGAGARRLAGAVLAEGLAIGLASGLLGLAAAGALLGRVVSWIPADVPRSHAIALDPVVASVGLLLAALTGLVTGVGPALGALRSRPSAVLRETGAGAGTSRWLKGVLEGLVVGQVALATLLTLGAGLLLRSFVSLSGQDPGFDPARVTVAEVSLPSSRYATAPDRSAFARELLERARGLPGAESVALGRNLPISASNMTSPLMVEGQTQPTAAAQIVTVSADYFRVMGIPVLDGATFPDDGGGADGPPLLVVSEALRTPDGRALRLGDRAHSFFGNDGMREVVGVVGDVLHGGLGQAPPAIAYEPLFQKGVPSSLALLVRSDAPTVVVADATRALLRELDPELPADGVSTLSARISRSLAEPRFYATGLGLFGALAVALALAGCHAGLAHRVAAQRRELGLRMALGASPPRLRRSVVARGMALVGSGAALGLAMALPASAVLDHQLYGIERNDPLTYGLLVMALVMVGSLAADLPARKAAAMDPAETLREN